MSGPALILVDIQQGFGDPFWGGRNNPDAEAVAGRLLAQWRAQDLPLFHVRHASSEAESPLRPDRSGFAFHPAVAPLAGEPILTKQVNSSFIGTDLEARLRAAGIGAVVVCGLTTPHCVSTTVRMAANLGFGVRLVADACAAVAVNGQTGFPGSTLPAALDPELIHQMALAQLHEEFCQVVDSAALIG